MLTGLLCMEDTILFYYNYLLEELELLHPQPLKYDEFKVMNSEIMNFSDTNKEKEE